MTTLLPSDNENGGMMPQSTVYFADAQVEALEKNKTLPAKFGRMLKRLKLAGKVKDKNVVIKMHLGADIGFTTISPVFMGSNPGDIWRRGSITKSQMYERESNTVRGFKSFHLASESMNSVTLS